MKLCGLIVACTGAVLISAMLSLLPASAGSSTVPMIAEVRRTFTINGNSIPPEIFRDFGDGDLADAKSVWVAVDIKAAVGSNQYFDKIEQKEQWICQKKTGAVANVSEETRYRYYGATENGLLVVLATYSGGGTGIFFTLHILDLAPGRAIDLEGKIYERINLTNIRSIALGDRWKGEIYLERNTVRVVTTRTGPADNSGKQETQIFKTKRL